LPCGISSSASPRCFEPISTTDVRATCTRSKNTIFGDCPPSACGKPPAFAFEIRLAAATSPLRFEEDARPPFGHPASNGSCLTACCRLRVNRHGAAFEAALKRAAVFSTAIHSADQALWHSETTHRRVSKHSACAAEHGPKTGARQCIPLQTLSPSCPRSILRSASLGVRTPRSTFLVSCRAQGRGEPFASSKCLPSKKSRTSTLTGACPGDPNPLAGE